MPIEEKNGAIATLVEKGIAFIDVERINDQEEFNRSLAQARNIVALHKGNAKILIHMRDNPVFRTSKFRKYAAEKIKELMDEIGQVKSAIYAESIVTRAVSKFIMLATGYKDYKIFETKEESIRWLEE